jgi:lipopolysaccharide export system permease protein
MQILDKYIIKNFLLPFFYCLMLFIFLYMIIDLFGHLDEILKHGTPILMLEEYYLSMIPFIMMHTAPVASLIAVIYVISSMNKYDEITAMRAAGISVLRILTPFICVGLGISITIFVVSEKLLPLSMKNVQFIKERYIEKKDIPTKKNDLYNIALYGKNDRLIFIKSYSPNKGIIKGITILQQDANGNVTKKTSIEEGKWTGGATWTCSSVLIYELDDEGLMKGNPLLLEELSLDLENPDDIILKGRDYESMNFKDLAEYIGNFSNAPPDIIRRLKVDMHNKISFPFTSLILIIIGAAFAMKIRKRGKTAAIMGIGISLVIGFMYYATMATFLAFGKGGILPPLVSAHLANILFGAMGIILIKN